QSSYFPGCVASHSQVQPHHAYGDLGSWSVVGIHEAPPSALRSTLTIVPRPDHARPSITCVDGSTKRVRDMKSGIPGGTISARGRIVATGAPESPARDGRASGKES